MAFVVAAVSAAIVTTHFDDENFTKEDVIGTWAGPNGQSITFHPDGTASVKRFDTRVFGVLSGPGNWAIVDEMISARVEPYGSTFYGARSLVGGFTIYAYVDDPDQPNAREFWSRQ
ncbi:hypothetical protein [Leifsonia sp. C5G2]|uniref:hypothetical protein n=1 Tax=Leifsonia sp. C5G2 TaxID=2735269 RepID=UPI001584CBBC|nr:hypothetical protein [Leifsonia sp. C5G2]